MKMEVKNIITKYCVKINECYHSDCNFEQIIDVVCDAVDEVENMRKQKRSERKCNVNPDTNLCLEQKDILGRRRYRLGAIDDEPVMIPDSEGFWTPVISH